MRYCSKRSHFVFISNVSLRSSLPEHQSAEEHFKSIAIKNEVIIKASIDLNVKNNIKLLADRVKTFIPEVVKTAEPAKVSNHVVDGSQILRTAEIANLTKAPAIETAENLNKAVSIEPTAIESNIKAPETSENPLIAKDSCTATQNLSSDKYEHGEIDEDSAVSRMIRETSESHEQVEEAPVEIAYPEINGSTKRTRVMESREQFAAADETMEKKLKYESPLEFLRMPKNKYDEMMRNVFEKLHLKFG